MESKVVGVAVHELGHAHSFWINVYHCIPYTS